MMSHVAAQENHLDWYTLQLRDASGAIRTLKLLGPRRESGPVKVELKPGARIEHSIDLTVWAERPINGGKPLAAGTYQVTATYDVPPGDGRWSGHLDAEGWKLAGGLISARDVPSKPRRSGCEPSRMPPQPTPTVAFRP